MSTLSPPPTGAWRGPWGPPVRSPVPGNLAPQPSGSGNLAPQRDVASIFLGPLPGGLLRSVEAAPASWRQALLVGLMRWAVSPQGDLAVCWREPYHDSVTLSDQTRLVVGPGSGAAWSTPEVVTYDFPLTEPSTPVVNLIDPSACYGPDGRLVLATHPGLLVEQAWVAEGEETSSGSPPVGWLATTRLHSTDWTKPEFLHASSSSGLTLLLWFASGADITGTRGLFAATGTPPVVGSPVPGATLAGLDWSLERDDIAQVIERLDVVAELSGQLRSTSIAGEYWLDVSPSTSADLALSVTVGDDVILWRLGATGSTQQVWDSYRVLEVEPTQLRLAWAGAATAPNLALVPYEDAIGHAFQGPHVAFPGVVVDPSDRVHVFWFESRVPIDEILADASEPVRLCYRSGTLESLVDPVTEEKIKEVGILASLMVDLYATSPSALQPAKSQIQRSLLRPSRSARRSRCTATCSGVVHVQTSSGRASRSRRASQRSCLGWSVSFTTLRNRSAGVERSHRRSGAGTGRVTLAVYLAVTTTCSSAPRWRTRRAHRAPCRDPVL